MRRATTTAPFCATLLVVLGACEQGSEPAAGLADSDGIQADQVVYGARQNMTTEGVRDAILDADSLFMWADSSHVRIEGLRLTVFSENGTREATITAERGRLSEANSELIAMGDVVLTIADGNRQVRSEEIRFAPDTDRIWTDSAVVMTDGECTVSGTRMQADMSFEDVRIWGTSGQECDTR